MIDELRDLIGKERDLDAVSGALRDTVLRLHAPVVGALELNCSDESELECGAVFQRQFVDHLLPDLKTAARAPFRTCNLGARYEWGSVRVAEHHYALPASADAFKVMLLKLNGHVSVETGPQGPLFGPMRRYDTESAACGALHALLAGQKLPALTELREALTGDGHDRLATLLDPQRVNPAYRHLFASIASIRRQAERALDDIREHHPHTPTLYVVVPCVTFNRSGPDTEMIVGVARVDRRGDGTAVEYHGLGDDPARYQVQLAAGRLRVCES